ncbi:hypothetical protein Poli38472_000575 [Pythium oligandrum]|uniref:E3 ubiquitin-protein ligase n=1 Tax=Pythium oligandrum TaxID=41045 RepID=A0A8K1CDC7_PYTOL|nr:hypothetical protein Poli38472_000575 [Pythium oligandrum]|eukprot:TMW60533.1 hypothetical protein Poli38472_000575 [Pythium oligandrum]
MVTLRGKKTKATTASRKAVEKSARGLAAGKSRKGAQRDESQLEHEEHAQQLVRFVTQTSLALQRVPTEKSSLAGFLDAMLTAFCHGSKEKRVAPQQLLARLTSAARKRVCGIIFSSDEIAYSCRNCQVDSTCVICKDCFMHGDHTGHDVYFQRTTAGSSCDCGDPHAWKISGFCSRHPGADDAHATAEKKDSLPKEIRTLAPIVIETVVEHVHQVLLGIDHGFQFAEALELFSREIPEHILVELSETYKHQSARDTESTEAIAGRRPRRSQRRVTQATETTASSDDQVSVDSASSQPEGVAQFGIRLHNDDVHSLSDVVKDLCSTLTYSKTSARDAVTETDRNGDYVVEKSNILACALPVGQLVRRSLNISVAPVWWEQQMEEMSSILEWLRAISSASDGLGEIVSETLRKIRPARVPFAKFSDCAVNASKPTGFWRDRSRYLHATALEMISSVIGEADLCTWAAEVESTLKTRYTFRPDADISAHASPEDNDNLFIAEFLKGVSLSRTHDRHQSVRDGCAAVLSKYVVHPSRKNSVLGLMVRWDCALRKKTTQVSHALLREHMLEKDFRKHMLEEYAHSYQAMTESFLKGLGNSTDSIFDFAVQFLTVPHLVREYTRAEVRDHPERPQIAFELLCALEQVFSKAIDSNGNLNVDHPALSSQKYKHCIDDLEYVFNIGGVPNELVFDKRNLGIWISCLKLLQNGDLQKRRGVNQTHVEYESDSWLSMFNLGIRVHSVFPVSWNGIVNTGVENEPARVAGIFRDIVDATVESSSSLNRNVRKKRLRPLKFLSGRGGDDPEITAYDFNVAKEPVSLHAPLHRFLSASLRHTSIHQTWLLQALNSQGFLTTFSLDQLSPEQCLEMIEAPLRSLVMASQIHSNLWRRNGEENMMAQLYNYSALPYCVNYRDTDVFLLQVGVLLLGPEAILSLMVDRFQLGSFFSSFSNDSAGYARPEEGIDHQQILQLTEEFLRLVIVMGTNLPSSTGQQYEDEFLKEEMLQHLCAKSYTFSKLFDISILPSGQDDVSIPRLEEVLAGVADFSPPTGLDPGRYELKDGLLKEYNPYFLHLNREAHELARDRWTSYRKTERKNRSSKNEPSPPLKAMRRPLSFLRPIQDILTCEGSVGMIHLILWKVLRDTTTSASPSISDAVISTCLHLLVYGVYSAIDANDDTFWTRLCAPSDTMDKTSIAVLLWELNKKHEDIFDDEQAGTLEWILSALTQNSEECSKVIKTLNEKDKRQRTVTTATSDNQTAASTMEQRREDARQRAMAAMARQQAAFQAMMQNMDTGDDSADEDDDDETQAEDRASARIDVDDDESGETTTLGKRRASGEGVDEDTKRQRLEDEDACYKCILCHDTSMQGEMGMTAYVHQSTVLSGAFRPDADEALKPTGVKVRKDVRALVEKMDLCSGGPNASPDSPSPTLRALTSQLPEWYMEGGLEDEIMLDSPLPRINIGGGRPNRRNRDRTNSRDGDLLPMDDELEVLESVLDLREDQRLFPMMFGDIASPDRRDRGARHPIDRAIQVVRRRIAQPMDLDSEDDEDAEPDHHDHDHDHDHRHHTHNHHLHHPHHVTEANRESVQLYLTPCGLHIRTCQHAVHIHCLERYIRSLHEKAIRGEDFDGVQAIDPDSAMTQFLCPLCKTLCNFVIPTSDPAGKSAEPMLLAIEDGVSSPASWHQVIDKQLKVPEWYRTVLGRDGEFGDEDAETHDLWRDYFEETLWEPHGSLEKGAPFLWSASAFTLASFLLVADQEHRNATATSDVFDPLTDRLPPALEKEFSSVVAVTKFCRWSFSLLEHSEDAKVIWETAKRCCPINMETKREHRKFSKVLGSIDPCLRGTILGLLVADIYTAFVVSCVIADHPSTIWQFMPIFSAADFLQRFYLEFFVQTSTDEGSLFQDKYTVNEVEDTSVDSVQMELPSEEASSSRRTRSRSSANASTTTSSVDVLNHLLKNSDTKDSEEYAVLTIVKRMLEHSESSERLKQLSKKEITVRLDRIKRNNSVFVRRMKLFWRCWTDKEAITLPATSLLLPSLTDIAQSSDAVFEQIWQWCINRRESKDLLAVAKPGDKCEHTDGCGENYVASMFIIRDQPEQSPRLIDLPVQYDELYSMMSGRQCTRCNKAPCDPGICLICGEFLCCGDSCCTSPFVTHGPAVGECTRHAAECGGGIGIVLMLDQCRVAVIGGSMAAHFPCPYVDAHGEEDVGLQRGRPLRLDMARYRYLESLWVNHRIFLEVSRQRNQREPQFTINLSYL